MPQVRFTENNMVNLSMSKAPFEIVRACSLCHVYDSAVITTIVRRSKVMDNVVEKAL